MLLNIFCIILTSLSILVLILVLSTTNIRALPYLNQ